MELLFDTIQVNYQKVLETISMSASSCGRDGSEITLVAVSKLQSVEKIEAAILSGALNFGENYPEEGLQKIASLAGYPQVRWHQIGHLQSRKCKLVAEHFHYFHALDSLDLAEKLNRALEKVSRVLPVLLELNISGETSKYGFPAQNKQQISYLCSQIETISSYSNLEINGLMTMPPYSENPEDSRAYFKQMVLIRDQLASQFQNISWKDLSMGTSGDYPVAIQEGATIIRVGQAIFGARQKL